MLLDHDLDSSPLPSSPDAVLRPLGTAAPLPLQKLWAAHVQPAFVAEVGTEAFQKYFTMMKISHVENACLVLTLPTLPGSQVSFHRDRLLGCWQKVLPNIKHLRIGSRVKSIPVASRKQEGSLICLIGVRTPMRVIGHLMDITEAREMPERMDSIVHEDVSADTQPYYSFDTIQRETLLFLDYREKAQQEYAEKFPVSAQHISMYMCKLLTGASSTPIGRSFCRDRSTILHAIGKVNRIKALPEVQEALNSVQDHLKRIALRDGITAAIVQRDRALHVGPRPRWLRRV